MPSTLYITEYAEALPIKAGQVVAAAAEPPLADQVVVTSAASAQSAALNAKTRYVRLAVGTAGVSVAISGNPTATTSNRRMAAGSVEYFTLNPVDVAAGLKYAAIDNP